MVGYGREGEEARSQSKSQASSVRPCHGSPRHTTFAIAWWGFGRVVVDSSQSHPRDAWQLAPPEPQDMGPVGPGLTPEGRLRPWKTLQAALQVTVKKSLPSLTASLFFLAVQMFWNVQAFSLQVPVSGRLHVMPIKKRYMKLTSWVRRFELRVYLLRRAEFIDKPLREQSAATMALTYHRPCRDQSTRIYRSADKISLDFTFSWT